MIFIKQSGEGSHTEPETDTHNSHITDTEFSALTSIIVWTNVDMTLVFFWHFERVKMVLESGLHLGFG